ncbi:MAG TPA: hypothetical protein VIJ40_05480 [Acidimicrobiales bacterium]
MSSFSTSFVASERASGQSFVLNLDDEVRAHREELKRQFDSMDVVLADAMTEASRTEISVSSEPAVKNERPPRPYAERQHVRVAGSWEGVVETIRSDSFSARIVELENGLPRTGTVQFTEFDIEDVDRGDAELIKEGSTFYWTIGRVTNGAGNVRNFSQVRFRRLPKLSVIARRKIRERSDSIIDGLH